MQRGFITKFVALLIVIFFMICNPGIVSAYHRSTIEDPCDNKIFSCNSYIDIKCDVSGLENTLYIGQSVAIPLTITYFTDIPDYFATLFPKRLMNYILFGQTTIPFQTIKLSVVSTPSWVDISFSNSRLIVPIPTNSSEYCAESVLYITPGKNAPNSPYVLTIQASCNAIGRINGVTEQETIVFTPAFSPQIDLSVDEQVIQVTPSDDVNINIEVTNLANKKAQITPTFLTFHPEWSPVILPPYIDLDPKENCTFTFSVIPPEDFSGYQTFKLAFTVETFPYHPDTASVLYPLDFIFYDL